MAAFTKSTLTPGIAAFGAGVIAFGLITVPADQPRVPESVTVSTARLDIALATTATPIDTIIEAIHSITWPLGYLVAYVGDILAYSVVGPLLPLYGLGATGPLLDLAANYFKLVKGIADAIAGALGFPPPVTVMPAAAASYVTHATGRQKAAAPRKSRSEIAGPSIRNQRRTTAASTKSVTGHERQRQHRVDRQRNEHRSEVVVRVQEQP